jgi:hypothetical protein
MTPRFLPKTEWQSYFDRMSKGLRGKQAEIEVTGIGFGDHLAAKWLSLLGITYDPNGDLLEIALDGLDHLIHQPREISVKDGPKGLTAVVIVDADRHSQIIKFKEP